MRLWDLATGRELGKLADPRGGVTALAFSPDGKRLAAGCADSTILLWDLAALTASDNVPAVKLAPKDLDAVWHDLLAWEASVAYPALWKLVAAPDQAVALLDVRARQQLPTVPRVKQLLADLDSAQYKVREQATRELESLGGGD